MLHRVPERVPGRRRQRGGKAGDGECGAEREGGFAGQDSGQSGCDGDRKTTGQEGPDAILKRAQDVRNLRIVRREIAHPDREREDERVGGG